MNWVCSVKIKQPGNVKYIKKKVLTSDAIHVHCRRSCVKHKVFSWNVNKSCRIVTKHLLIKMQSTGIKGTSFRCGKVYANKGPLKCVTGLISNFVLPAFMARRQKSDVCSTDLILKDRRLSDLRPYHCIMLCCFLRQ